MSHPGDFDYLLGTHVALSHPSAVHPQTFALDEKLSEDYQTMSQEEYDDGIGYPYAAIKFTCHNVLNSAEQGFIRIYAQIPVNGTLHSAAEVRAQQARSHDDHTEVEALVNFDEANCTAVPKLLGVSRIVQGPQDYVPGGYITSVAWARAPGEPVDVCSYWKASYEYRQEVRAAFRATFQELSRCGWKPWVTPPRKLIYDKTNKTMHIAGFRIAIPAQTEPFSDVTYACWGLAKPSKRMDWQEDSSDWTW